MKTLMSRLINFSVVLLLSIGFLSCDREASPKSEMVIQTGPAFMKPGETISSFVVVFEELGNKPIEEYGIVYTFDDDVENHYPDLTDTQIIFDSPAKQYSNEKLVNVEFPAGAHSIGYRAYAKFKGGEIKYAKPIIIKF